jgi:hypothetical protein
MSAAPHPTTAAPDLEADGALGLDEDDNPELLLRVRVWERYCHGARAPRIAEVEGVPARTVRRWIRQTREEVCADLPTLRAERFAAAIDMLGEQLEAAWDAVAEERDLDRRYNMHAYADVTIGVTADLQSPRD